ncbi:MAG: DUF2156 domain-containing protein [Nitrospirae bacterium]|nr:DUF2156 domain-containing protein [Nitrospirota bacterium]
MVSEKLSFSHRDLLYERLKKIDTQISEYSFPNLFLFRRAHNYEVISDREIFIRGIAYDGHTYLMPTVEAKDIDPLLLKEMMGTVDFLFPVPESWLSVFPEDKFEFSHTKGEMDYIYTVGKMSTYPGRHLHRKRNLLKHFTSSYEHRAVPLTREHIENAIFILKEWQEETGQGELKSDYGPCLEALGMSEELLLCGGIYYADDEPAGFILGEELNEETFVLHFAKARKKFRGIYQYIFSNFARILPPKYRYLNLEQDLDNEALRIAKASYKPDLMLRKMRVSLRR